jgi:hypothetical protein
LSVLLREKLFWIDRDPKPVFSPSPNLAVAEKLLPIALASA